MDGANSAPVKRVERIGAGSYGFVECGSRQLELAVVHIKVAEFFIVSSRWIVADRSFEFANAPAARKDFEGLSHESNVGKRLNKKIDNRAERAEKQDDKNPVGIRPPPNEVDDRQPLDDGAPRV